MKNIDAMKFLFYITFICILAGILIFILLDGPSYKETPLAYSLPSKETSSQSSSGYNNLIDLNKANADELAKIRKVSKSLAKAIVKFRNEYGDFLTHDELENVPGMTEDAYKRIVLYTKIE